MAPSIWAQPEQSVDPAILKTLTNPQPHVIWAPPPTAQDAQMQAQPTSIPDPGVDLHAGLKKIFAPMPEPTVGLDPNPEHQIEGHLTNRLQQEYAKDKPWNPDEHGVMGKIGHVFGKIGGGLADTFLPGVIPGTPSYRHDTEHNIAKEIGDVMGDEAKNDYTGAEAAKTQEETKEMPAKAASEEGLQDAETDVKRDQIANPPLAAAYAHAVNQALKENRDPSQDPIVQHLGDAITAIQKQPASKDKSSKTADLIGPDKKEHLFGWDDKTGKYDVDMGLKGEKPPVVNVNAADASIDRLAGRLAKPYQTGFDASSKQLDNIDKTVRSINSGYKGQALALPETLTSLVSGQGTGVRVTMPELQMVAQHNGVKGDIESFFNRISGEGSMTDEDKKQLSGILREARGILQQKAAIHQDALDKINGASSRAEIQSADKEARQKLPAA